MKALPALADQLKRLLLPGASPVPSHAAASSTAPLLAPNVSEPQAETPERYDGDPETCGLFITNCTLLLTLSSELAKVAFAINHLTGHLTSQLWGAAKWEHQSPRTRHLAEPPSMWCRSMKGMLGKSQTTETLYSLLV